MRRQVRGVQFTISGAGFMAIQGEGFGGTHVPHMITESAGVVYSDDTMNLTGLQSDKEIVNKNEERKQTSEEVQIGPSS